MSKFCSNCGNALEPGSKFCNNCGTPVGDVTVSPSPASQGQPVAPETTTGQANPAGAQNVQANGAPLPQGEPGTPTAPPNGTQAQQGAPGAQNQQAGRNGSAQDTLNNLQQSGEKLVQDGQKLAQESAQAINQYIQNMTFYNPTLNDVGIVENFFSFKGRLNRLRYFKRLLILEIIFYVVELLVRELFGDPFFGYLDTGGQIVFFLITMIYGASFLCLSFRRLLDIKDLRKAALPITGVLALMILIIACSANVRLEALFDSRADTFYTIAAAVRGLAELVLLVLPGMVGPNEFGPDRVVQPPQA